MPGFSGKLGALLPTTNCHYTGTSHVLVEWGDKKRRINLRKHGIDFVGCEAIFAGTTKTMSDDRVDYGEQRFLTLGLLENRVVAAVHTETADTIRVISIRKATKYEQALYFEGF